MKRNVILLITGFLLVLVLVFCLYIKTITTSVVYVDNQKVFDGFNMTKELKVVGEKELAAKKKAVDSLYLLLNDPNSKEASEPLMKLFIAERDKLEYYNTAYSNEQSLKIWSRIDSYGKDFSKENHYDIILGAQPGQNLIFGEDGKNVTSKFIEFINKKYEGAQ
ncbi:hypothetical protein FMM05_02630 [Flavobacterium zepuense]|uniref:Uncharacterized protein n=1 Tax=Flavobacterium zepuense TaxID=2593302 RepID=A0A552VAQ2_9FLAO|nr:hypothetical protein [Flavobacterium zepuense]TRW27554.1 hypothetical protein FMM05_02630 [Flavobacterium zepuense]